MVLDVDISDKELSEKVQILFDKELTIREELKIKKEHLYNLTSKMWNSVWQELGYN